MRAGWLVALLSAAVVLPGCGEHPCTLSVGEPGFCSATPDDAAPFCDEVCHVCDEVQGHRWETACRARCREEVGVPELTCEELDPQVESQYRECVETLDYYPCAQFRSGKP